jgi:hypothetical protein
MAESAPAIGGESEPEVVSTGAVFVTPTKREQRSAPPRPPPIELQDSDDAGPGALSEACPPTPCDPPLHAPGAAPSDPRKRHAGGLMPTPGAMRAEARRSLKGMSTPGKTPQSTAHIHRHPHHSRSGTPARHSFSHSPYIQRSSDNLFFDPVPPPDKPLLPPRAPNLSPFKTHAGGLMYFLDWGSSRRNSPHAEAPGGGATSSIPQSHETDRAESNKTVHAQPLPRASSSEDDASSSELLPRPAAAPGSSHARTRKGGQNSQNQFI